MPKSTCRLALATLSMLVVCVGGAFAQETLYPRAYQTLDQGIVYDREFTVPLAIHTNGLYLGLNRGRLRTYYKTAYYGATLGILKHPREVRSSERTVQFGQNAGSFVYGKRNTFLPIRAYRGWKRYYSGKDRRRGVAVGTTLEGGFTAGIVKPYVLEITTRPMPDQPPTRQYYTYDENPAGFTQRALIHGAGGLDRGWSGVSFVPGINFRAAVHLDWGAFDEFVKAFEAGIMVDAFPRAIPLLIEPADNTPLFINFYAALHLGRRR